MQTNMTYKFENHYCFSAPAPECKPPTCLTGPNAAFYESFDSPDGYVLMEGVHETAQKNFAVSGKVKLRKHQLFFITLLDKVGVVYPW